MYYGKYIYVVYAKKDKQLLYLRQKCRVKTGLSVNGLQFFDQIINGVLDFFLKTLKLHCIEHYTIVRVFYGKGFVFWSICKLMSFTHLRARP